MVEHTERSLAKPPMGLSDEDEAVLPNAVNNPTGNPKVGSADEGPLGRPFATSRCLAAFLRPAFVARHVPQLRQLPQQVRLQIEQRMGRCQGLAPVSAAGKVRCNRVTEATVLRLLDQVAQSPSLLPASLDNLIGFEWVEIATLLAGRLVTGAEPWPESLPEVLDIDAVARYCMLSYAKLPMPRIETDQAGNPRLVSAVRVETAGLHGELKVVRQNGIEHAILTVQYQLRPALQPIRVLIAGGRGVALTGLGRLLALRARGLERALCSVSYGYGQDAVLAFPSTEQDLLESVRPPLVTDFENAELAVELPVRAETTYFSVRGEPLSVF